MGNSVTYRRAWRQCPSAAGLWRAPTKEIRPAARNDEASRQGDRSVRDQSPFPAPGTVAEALGAAGRGGTMGEWAGALRRRLRDRGDDAFDLLDVRPFMLGKPPRIKQHGPFKGSPRYGHGRRTVPAFGC